MGLQNRVAKMLHQLKAAWPTSVTRHSEDNRRCQASNFNRRHAPHTLSTSSRLSWGQLNPTWWRLRWVYTTECICCRTHNQPIWKSCGGSDCRIHSTAEALHRTFGRKICRPKRLDQWMLPFGLRVPLSCCYWREDVVYGSAGVWQHSIDSCRRSVNKRLGTCPPAVVLFARLTCSTPLLKHWPQWHSLLIIFNDLLTHL